MNGMGLPRPQEDGGRKIVVLTVVKKRNLISPVKTNAVAHRAEQIFHWKAPPFVKAA